MKKIILILGLLFSLNVFSQRNFHSDTIPIIIYYSDTSCKYDVNEVQAMFNSKCMQEANGYMVMWMYTTEFLWCNKQKLPGNIEMWHFKLKN